jgi:hypothetical protein
MPTNHYIGHSLARQLIEQIADRQIPKDGDLVGPTPEPPEFVKAAQHPVRALAAIVAGSHLLLADHRPIWTECGRMTSRWSNRDQVAFGQLEVAAKNDLRNAFAAVDVRQPDLVTPRVNVHARDFSYSRAGYANDH